MMIRTNAIIGCTAVLLLAGCSGNDSSEGERSARAPGSPASGAPAATRPGAATSDSSGSMPGMDHSKMQMGDSGSGGRMTGMDHSNMDMRSAPAGTMPGMGHSGMKMGAASGMGGWAGGEMPGMDHSKMSMAGPSVRARAGSMPGMDHSTMNMGATSGGGARGKADMAGMAGMDHANMPGTQHAAAATQPSPCSCAAGGSTSMPGMSGEMQGEMPGDMAGHDMNAMSGMADGGSQKLQQLLNRLVADPVVGQKIQRDSVLRNRWQDPVVRQIVLTQP